MANRAVLVGVSRYSAASGFRELKAPINDVARLQACLERNGNFEVVPLVDASKQEVERQTRVMLSRAKPEDRIVFYYSGHAYTMFPSGQLLLTLTEYERDDPEAGSIEKRKLFEWARAGSAGQLVMILDCCFAAAGGSDLDYGRSGPVVDGSDFRLEREGGGTHVLMASDGETRAQSGDLQTADGRASHFTDLLVRGLEGDAAPGEARVTIRKLSEFLDERAAIELKARPRVNVQDAYGDFTLVQVKNPDRTLIPREHRDGASSLRPVERIGAVTLLGCMLANPQSERHRRGALELLEEIRDSPTSQDDVRRAAEEALAAPTTPRQVLEAQITVLERDLERRQAEANDATAKLSATQEQLAAMLCRQAEADKKIALLLENARQLEQQVQDGQRGAEALEVQRGALQLSLDEALRERAAAERRAEEAQKRAAALPDRETEDPELERLRNERDELKKVAEAVSLRATLNTSQIKLLMRQTEMLSEGARSLKAKLAESEQRRQALGREGEDAQRQIILAELSAAAAERRAELRQQDIETLETRITTLESDLFKLREANTALRTRRDNQDQTVFQQETELNHVKDLLSKYQSKAKDELLDEMQIRYLEHQLSSTQGELQSLVEALDRERTENEAKEKSLQQGVSDLEGAVKRQHQGQAATKRALYASLAMSVLITAGALVMALSR